MFYCVDELLTIGNYLMPTSRNDQLKRLKLFTLKILMIKYLKFHEDGVVSRR